MARTPNEIAAGVLEAGWTGEAVDFKVSATCYCGKPIGGLILVSTAGAGITPLLYCERHTREVAAALLQLREKKPPAEPSILDSFGVG